MKTYLIAGESYRLVEKEVESIISKFSVVIKYDLRVGNLGSVVEEANYFSLTGEEKCIVVKATDIFCPGKNDKEDTKEEKEDKYIKMLDAYLDNPNELTTLVFVCSKLPDKRRKLFKRINNDGIVTMFPSLNKKDLTYECMNILKTNGYKADYEVANYIVENSYVNYDIMISEINKINILCKKGNIGISDIKNVISKSISVSVRNFINSLVNREIQKSVKYSEYFETLKIEPIVILITLANEFEIYYLLKLGVNPKEIQIKYQKEDWKMREYLMNVDNYTLKEIKKIITNLNDYDYKLKSGLLDRELLVDLLILEFCE